MLPKIIAFRDRCRPSWTTLKRLSQQFSQDSPSRDWHRHVGVKYGDLAQGWILRNTLPAFPRTAGVVTDGRDALLSVGEFSAINLLILKRSRLRYHAQGYT
jgi:hypothetical protein